MRSSSESRAVSISTRGGRRRGVGVVAQPAADLDTVDVGQRQVETDEVVGIHTSLRERLVAVVGDVDGIALAAQPPTDRVGQFDFVIDDHDSHRDQRIVQDEFFYAELRPDLRHCPRNPQPRSCSTDARRPSPTATVEAPTARPALRQPTPVENALMEVKKVIVGQDRTIERLFVCLLARGHVLLEGVPGRGQDARRRDPRSGHRRHVRPLAVHARPPARRHRGHPHLPIVERSVRHRTRSRSSPTSCSPTRSTVRPPRCSPRCSRSWPSKRCRSAASRSPRRIRSSCSPRRTRSSPRASIPCPRRSATASS